MSVHRVAMKLENWEEEHALKTFGSADNCFRMVMKSYFEWIKKKEAEKDEDTVPMAKIQHAGERGAGAAGQVQGAKVSGDIQEDAPADGGAKK